VTTSGEHDGLAQRLETLRAEVLARAALRFRGLTATERDLLDWTTVQLMDEFLRSSRKRTAKRADGGR
jgi:hypothetical protein